MNSFKLLGQYAWIGHIDQPHCVIWLYSDTCTTSGEGKFIQLNSSKKLAKSLQQILCPQQINDFTVFSKCVGQ